MNNAYETPTGFLLYFFHSSFCRARLLALASYVPFLSGVIFHGLGEGADMHDIYLLKASKFGDSGLHSKYNRIFIAWSLGIIV
jgi:hypothetical protein